MATKKRKYVKLGNKLTLHTIQTVYYFGKEVVKRNRAMHANAAVVHCVSHMQLNTYEAESAEVYDLETGVLHAVIRRTLKGMTIVYKRPVQESYS